ncbi:MAG: type II toxin-antitoxin system PemK/MazF family toxin [Acidimicrobiaceae bacterium]|nr:type II toxin-antitoxin system PemK/MazF family toxin [Acidimicrobiaceae bacterium]MXW76291.1 type II toxin-antitoxin system PemK/MazF family toxin [Acidimicrobiaceae bacterium]MYA74492.1 type II toxin-antitoxin system PemK/MazF family toxin [Acidimicrobiaceae bacterium]MYC43865.1 type II toxin-antitoxin system PemK/MazF family toxin [Acidimicrobiaceae bacterium]MYD07783.1 type II toxin-antitoxin system PemK/MazF family toxin [Acidimicrobiaceae bacterium]
MTALPQRGEVWWCEVPDKHRRPVAVLSRDAAISVLRRVIVAPCSTVDRNLVSEVRLEPEEDPIRRACVIQLDATFNTSVTSLTARLGRLSGTRMQQVCEALSYAVACR